MTVSEVSRENAVGTAFWQKFGNALFSVNLWLYIAAFEVALTLLSPLPGEQRVPVLNLTAGVIASAALLAVVALGWLLARNFTGGLRVIVSLPFFVLAGVARGITLQWLLSAWGLSDLGIPAYQWRATAGVMVVVLGAFTGVLVKLGVEGHRYRLERLEAEQQRLALVLARAQEDVRSEQSGTVAAVSRSLSEQLSQLTSVDASRAVDLLEEVATSVVRPLSHELAAATPMWQPPEDPIENRRQVDWSRVWGTATSIGYIEPMLPAVFVLTIAPLSMLFMGLSGLLLHAIAASMAAIGLWLLRRGFGGLPSPASIPVRFAFILGMLMLACVPAALCVLAFPSTTSQVVNALYVLLVVPLVALLASFVRATWMQRRRIEAELVEVVEQTRWWISRTRMVGWWQSATLARKLHGPVQSALHTATARLRAEVEAGATSEVLDSILQDLGRTLSKVMLSKETPTDVFEELADLAAVWQSLAAVDHEVGDEVRGRLAADVVCTQIAMDIIGEAVSNAVRHGAATRVGVRLELSDEATLLILILDDGSGWESGDQRAGLGTSQLDICALTWEHSPAPGGHLLCVGLPLLGAASGRVSYGYPQPETIIGPSAHCDVGQEPARP